MGHFWKAVIGEGIATTFLLLSVLTGGTFAAGAGPAYGYALAFGFSVLTLVYAFNDISGGHVNNIISFALFLMGRISLIRCLCYTGAQIGGAILGALIAQAVVDNDAWGCGVVTPPDNVDTFWVILLEVIFTALLTLVALSPMRPRSLGVRGPSTLDWLSSCVILSSCPSLAVLSTQPEQLDQRSSVENWETSGSIGSRDTPDPSSRASSTGS